jgi:hypothetical protein
MNDWFTSLFANLNLKQNKHEIQKIISYWETAFNSTNGNPNNQQPSTQSEVENTLKLLQLESQFVLYIIQNLYEFEVVNSLLAQQDDTSSDSSAANNSITPSQNHSNIIEKFTSKKASDQANVQNQFNNLVELIKMLTNLFYNFIKSQPSLSQSLPNHHKTTSLSDEDEYHSKNFEFSNDSKNNSATDLIVDSKQAVQIFVNLIEILSVLFNKIKSYSINSEFLFTFSHSIEQLTDLYSISKANVLPTNTNASLAANDVVASPSNALKKQHQQIQQHLSHLNSHFRFTKHSMIAVLQSNRKSNDLFDTFSMQIASYIQNNLPKKFFKHEFDSNLLHKLEPIFYSFLTHQTTKLSLKQKTLQAWNSTFGKSTVTSLNYTKRLEKLFVELREEMINNSKGISNTGLGFVAISLPGFKPIDLLLNQATNTASNSVFITQSNNNQMIMDEECEKENTPETLSSQNHISNESNQNRKSTISKLGANKDFLINDSSSSVPIVHFVPINKLTEVEMMNSDMAAILPPQNQVLTTGFVFSPISTQKKTNFSGAASCSKIQSMKTPDTAQATLTRQTSRTPLGTSSKRKLDLNFQIDQLPDDQFVEIPAQKPKQQLPNKRQNIKDTKEDTGGKSLKASSSRKSTGSALLFKQPLTEHQKESRRARSFIPSVMQSVCREIDLSTIDSQMSMMDDDTNTQSLSQMPTVAKRDEEVKELSLSMLKVQKNEEKTANAVKQENLSMHINDENAMEMEYIQQPTTTNTTNITNVVQQLEKNSAENNNNDILTDDDSKESIKSDDSLKNTSSKIKFHSKINPKKKIQLIEINKKEEDEVDNNLVVLNQKVENKERQKVKEISANEVQVEKDDIKQENEQLDEQEESKMLNNTNSTPSRRRSMRLNNNISDNNNLSQTQTMVEKPIETEEEAQKAETDEHEIENDEEFEECSSSSQFSSSSQNSTNSESNNNNKAVKKLDKAKLKSNLIKKSRRLLMKQKNPDNSNKITLVKIASSTSSSNSSTSNNNALGNVSKKSTQNLSRKKALQEKLKLFVKGITKPSPHQPTTTTDNEYETEKDDEEDEVQQQESKRASKNAKKMELINKLNTELNQTADLVVVRTELNHSNKSEKEVIIKMNDDEAASCQMDVSINKSLNTSTSTTTDEDDQPLSKLIQKRKHLKSQDQTEAEEKQPAATGNPVVEAITPSHVHHIDTRIPHTPKVEEPAHSHLLNQEQKTNNTLEPLMEEDSHQQQQQKNNTSTHINTTPPSTPIAPHPHPPRTRRESILVDSSKIDDVSASAPLTTESASTNNETTTTTLTSSLTKPQLTTDTLLQRLNNTPTTSILKKRISKLAGNAPVDDTTLTLAQSVIQISQNKILDALRNKSNTPLIGVKRRVSFCESVKIEEIEPNNKNFNRSLLSRSIPKLQNKSKIVLSPYFSNSNSNFNSLNNGSSPVCTANTAASQSSNGLNKTLNTSDAMNKESEKESSMNNSSSLTNTSINSIQNVSNASINATCNTTQGSLSTTAASLSSSTPSSALSSPVTTGNKIPLNLNSIVGSGGLSSFLQMKYNANNNNNAPQSSSLSMPASPIQQQQGAQGVPSVNSGGSLLNFFNNKQSFVSPRFLMLQQKREQQQQQQQQQQHHQNSSVFDSPKAAKSVSEAIRQMVKSSSVESMTQLPQQQQQEQNHTPKKSTEEKTQLINNKQMGSVEEEMEKLEASSNMLDTSIETETLIEMNKQHQAEKELEQEEKTTGMDVEMEPLVEPQSVQTTTTTVISSATTTKLTTETVNVEQNVETNMQSDNKQKSCFNLVERFESKLKEFVNQEFAQQVRELNSINDLNKFDDLIDDARVDITSFLNNLQREVRKQEKNLNSK